MEKASRIVRCPKCLALLQEPPQGTPLYKCGNCNTVLRAKHASSDGSGARRVSARAQQQMNRASPPAQADSIDGRRVLSKPMPPDLPSRQTNVDLDDYRNRTGNSRLSPAADTGRKSPTQATHRSFPPGPTPPTHADNGSRPGHDHLRPVPRDPLASPSNRGDGFQRGREAPIHLLQTKVSSPAPAAVEEVHWGQNAATKVYRNFQSPPNDPVRNPLALGEAGDEQKGLVDKQTRNPPATVNLNNTRQDSPPVDSTAEGARHRRSSPDITSENVKPCQQQAPPADSASESAARHRQTSRDVKNGTADVRQKSPPLVSAAAEALRHGLPSPDVASEGVATREKVPSVDLVAPELARSGQPSEDVKTRQNLPQAADEVAEPARNPRRPSADLTRDRATNRASERLENEDDLRSFSPTKALAALRILSTGPLYKVKERQAPGLGLGPASKNSQRNAQGFLVRGRNRSQGDEPMGTKIAADLARGQNVDTVETGPSTSEEALGLHRRQRSDGIAITERSRENDLFVGNPALPAGTRWRSEDEVKAVDESREEPTPAPRVQEMEGRDLHNLEVPVEEEKRRNDPPSAQGDKERVTSDQKPITRASSSDVAKQLKVAANMSPPKTASTIEQVLLPASDVSLAGRVHQKEPDLKAPHNEALVFSNNIFDHEGEPGALLFKQVHSPPKLPRATRKESLSPPRFLSSKSVFGGTQPEPEPSKARASSRQDSYAPASNRQDFHGLPDVLDYDTSEDSSNVDDTDPYQITSKSHSEELAPPTFPHNGQETKIDPPGGICGGSDDDDEQEPTDPRPPHSRSQDPFATADSGAKSPYFSPHRSPESRDSVSPSQPETSDQRKQEMQGTFNKRKQQQADGPESTSSFSFGGQGGHVHGSPYASLKGKIQKVRLQINTPIPERIHVRCRHCNLQLEVPVPLARSETGIQKLRCGSCWKVSRFRLNHLLSPGSGTSSPARSDRSPESSFRLGSSDGTSGRYSGTRSNRETGTQDRVVIRTQSGANLPVPPSARHNPRAASGSKLANMVSSSNIPSATGSKASTPNTSGDLGPLDSSPRGGKEGSVGLSPSGQAEPSQTSLLSPTLSSTSQDVVSSKARQQQKSTTSPDRRLLQSSSDSDEDKAASVQLKIGGPSGFNPSRTTNWSAPETPEFDDGHEFKGLKGFLKKSVKEFTKGKKSTQYRRKVVVNGHAVPDDVVRRAEEYAGGIHPGSYWYDFRAGFWGVMGGPCLGMIPPFIEELNFPLARHCSHGKTGVMVNGRELHHKDLELLKKRGLPGAPGKAYNVDIDGRLTEETTGVELKGLGRLAPTLEQTGRGPGMWVPESQRGS